MAGGQHVLEGEAPTLVVHGATAGTARPAGATLVQWRGTVAPTHAVTNDEWYDQASDLLKRWSGTAWKAAGSATYVPFTSSGQGIYKKTSATYGDGWIFGTAASFGFAGTGTPADIFGAFAVYQQYGAASPGSNVTKTTQGAFINTLYYGPTSDDSAEGVNSAVFMKDDGNLGWTQTKPITAVEGNARTEGAVVATTGDTAAVSAFGGRVNVLGTSHVGTAAGFKSSVNSDTGTKGTIDKYIAFWQPASADANGGTVTTKYGVYTVDPINSETGLTVSQSVGSAFQARYGGGSDGSTSVMNVGQPVLTYGTLSGTYTLTTTPQNLTTNGGVTLPAGGGTFMLDSAARTIVTYTAFSGTTITNATVASGSVATTNGQAMIDPNAPNTTAVRVNGQRGQSKNIAEWWDGSGNLRMRFNASGNLVTQGTSFFGATGAAVSTCEMNGSSGYIRPGLSTGGGSHIWSGSGAPNITTSVAGDVYFRTDTPSTANQRIYVATAANTWSGVV